MVKSLRSITKLLALIVLLCGCKQSSTKNNTILATNSISIQPPTENTLPKYLQVLNECYGKHFSILNANTIIWQDGDTLILDDSITKDCKTVITNADIEDQFRTPYPKGERIIPKDECFDPGRIRNERFFRKMYGKSEKNVKAQLDTVWWPSVNTKQALLVHVGNGCKDSLQKVANALSKLPKPFLKYISPSAGTFNYRKIAGTDRLSCHSYGIAIDLNVKHSHYWRWTKDKNNVIYKNAIPFEIVEIFEKYGFIWGGYWYHYDTMHFEFRPELIKFTTNE